MYVFLAALMAGVLVFIVSDGDVQLFTDHPLLAAFTLLIGLALCIVIAWADAKPDAVNSGAALLGASIVIILSGDWATDLDAALASAPDILHIAAVMGYGLALPITLGLAVITPVARSAWRDWGPTRSSTAGSGQRVIKANESPRQ